MAKILPDLSKNEPAAGTKAIAAAAGKPGRGTSVGRNVTAHLDGSVLVLRIDTRATGAKSASGKSVVIGTTNGNVTVPGCNGAKLGLNFYMPNDM